MLKPYPNRFFDLTFPNMPPAVHSTPAGGSLGDQSCLEVGLGQCNRQTGRQVGVRHADVHAGRLATVFRLPHQHGLHAGRPAGPVSQVADGAPVQLAAQRCTNTEEYHSQIGQPGQLGSQRCTDNTDSKVR